MKARRLPVRGPYQVLAVCDPRGRCTLLDFLSTLGANHHKQRNSMLSLLEKVARNGPELNDTVSHQIRNKIWEFKKNRLRVLWFYDIGKVIVCTHALLKQSQKIPKSEIDKAERARERYFEAKRTSSLVIEEENDGEEDL